MNCIRLCLLLFVFLTINYTVEAQSEPCDIDVSLLTCAPGEDLYSLWGHAAILIKPVAGKAIVYNYGTFDFDDPGFYEKFTRGKLLYFVSVADLDQFMLEYEYENRTVVEQKLNLSCEDKRKLFAALQVNAREENRYYYYDFVRDNCATRLRDIIVANAGDSVVFGDILPSEKPSFRQLIHEYLDRGNQPWSKFGIDLLLGSRLDSKSTDAKAMFLPDYLRRGFAGAGFITRSSALLSDAPDTGSAQKYAAPRRNIAGGVQNRVGAGERGDLQKVNAADTAAPRRNIAGGRQIRIGAGERGGLQQVSAADTAAPPRNIARGVQNRVGAGEREGVGARPVVAATMPLFSGNASGKKAGERSYFTPVLAFSLLFVLIFILSVVNAAKPARLNGFFKVFDTAYFLILGLLGVFILFMWFGTDHYWCADNYNLLWALPLHLPAALFIIRGTPWIKHYFQFSTIFYALLLLAWNWLPQGMNSAFLPVVMLAGTRSAFRLGQQAKLQRKATNGDVA